MKGSVDGAGKMPVSPLRLLVVDDDAESLDLIAGLFRERKEVELVGVESSGRRALQTLASVPADVALVDVDMPGLDGIETAKRIRSSFPDVVVLIYTNFEYPDSLPKAMEAGVRGVLTKDMPFCDVVQSVLRAYRGSTVMGDQPMNILVSVFDTSQGRSEIELMRIINELPDYLLNTLDHLMLGRTNPDIAKVTSLSVNTARSYVSELLANTGCVTRTELAVRAARGGYKGAVEAKLVRESIRH